MGRTRNSCIRSRSVMIVVVVVVVVVSAAITVAVEHNPLGVSPQNYSMVQANKSVLINFCVGVPFTAEEDLCVECHPAKGNGCTKKNLQSLIGSILQTFSQLDYI